MFPDALVLLSTRPSEDWYRNAISTIFQLDSESSPFIDVWRERFGFYGPFDDAEAMIAAYERHNASVRSSVPPDRLLEWTFTDGWGPSATAWGSQSPTNRSPVPTRLRSSGPTMPRI